MTQRNLFQSILLLGLVLFYASCSSTKDTGRQFVELNDLQGKIELTVSDGKYEIVPFNEKIIHTTFYPTGQEVKNFSFAVENQPEKLDYVVTDNGDDIKITVDKMEVSIVKSPFNISYSYNGKLLISENDGYVKTDTSQKINLKIDKEEVLFGGGARALGMNRRGHRLQLYNRAHYGYGNHSELMNYTLPVFLSSKKYAVLFDNASAGFLDLDSKKNNTINYETATGTMNYHVIAGDNWYDLVEQYTDLTGKQPLPPRWAFGCFSSRFGYHSQKETEETVNKFFKDEIPLDAVILDIYWFGKEVKGTMGNLNWYTDSFPNPEKMIADFTKKGVNTILITEPFILTTCDRWDEAVEKKVLALDSVGEPYKYDFFFGNTGLIDVFDDNARNWYWDVYKKFINQGVTGWWGDLGEPEMHPADIIHATGTGDELHNAYGQEWARIISDGYEKEFPEQRPFILMRAGYAGSQRYGMIPWTGDVSRSWEGLMPQPEISLQMGMQGIAYMHSDLGGFAGDHELDSELYTRWLQYGVFQPIYRPHAQESISPEPVFQDVKTKALVKKAIELRYKLKPYIYNMAYKNSSSGTPLMTPLFFNETDNDSLYNNDKEYMWGEALLVSPVKEKGEKEQKVYLTKGSNWYDFYTGEMFKGGEYHNVKLDIESIPVFVKGGSFIPMAKEAVNEKGYSLKDFELHYYADELVNKSEYKMYNDDGKTPGAFEKGQYEMFNFSYEGKANSDSFTIQKDTELEQFKNMINNIKLIVHNIKTAPTKITVNGEELTSGSWTWTESKNTLEISTTCSAEKSVVNIEL